MSADPRFDGPGPDQAWRDALAAGRFLIQHCAACGGHQFPPALVCRRCGAERPGFVEASGRGTVYSSTTVREREGSYNVSLVELAEGPRMMTRVEGLQPEAVSIGLPVIARIVQGEEPLVVFNPAEGSAP